MAETRRFLWPAIKAVLAAIILACVGWQFARVLSRPELWENPPRIHPGWLLLAGLLYIGGLACWGSFWLRLLARFDEPVAAGPAMRAYFVSHLGKYVPGKAWALVLRVTLVRPTGVRGSAAALTAVYETLATMASGALLAAVLLPIVATERGRLLETAVILLAVAGLPLLPQVFNALARRAAKPFLRNDPRPLPPVALTTLLGGLARGACGWAFMGLSLGVTLTALDITALTWDWTAWPRWTAFVAVAYVAGFATLPAPGGLGVREAILQQLLIPECGGAVDPAAAGRAALVVLVLRLVWTAAEVITAGGMSVFRPRSINAEDAARSVQ